MRQVHRRLKTIMGFPDSSGSSDNPSRRLLLIQPPIDVYRALVGLGLYRIDIFETAQLAAGWSQGVVYALLLTWDTGPEALERLKQSPVPVIVVADAAPNAWRAVATDV